MDAELMAKLDEYLDGCPDPTGKPWWLVKRSSRLLWECRERLRALSPPASAAVVPIPKVQATAPERIWLAVADDKHYADEPFPDGVEEVCWSHDAPLEVCVPYVRADLATPTPPAAAQEDGRDALLGFAADVLDYWPDGAPDGGDLQELAVKHGLLIATPAVVPCGENCACTEFYDEGDTADCYHRAPWLTALSLTSPDSGKEGDRG